MADFLYDSAKHLILTQQLNLVTSNIKMMLVSTIYSPDPTQQFIDSGGSNTVKAAEISGTGYAHGFGGSGRKLLTGKEFVTDSLLHREEYHFDDVSWAGLNVGLTMVGGCILVLEVGTSDQTSLLIAFRGNGFPQTTTGTELRISNDTHGFFRI